MMIIDTRHSVSVAGVVIDEENRALLIQRRDNSHWEPPGGVLELSESIEDGVRREVFEETGLAVDPIALTGVYKNIKRGIVALVFKCRIVEGSLRENAEVRTFHWATRDDVLAMTSEAFAVRILDALDSPGHPAVRLHDGVHLVLAAPAMPSL